MMSGPNKPRCKKCGANRDYITRTGDDFKCGVCGATWTRYS